ncbi:MAG: metallophosphatase [Bacteroidetes bacterium]|nr:metallophosphatase [Bacteroidota bacterium]
MRTKCLLLCICLTFLAINAQNTSELKFRQEGVFRIVQFTDIHYKTNHSEARKGLEKLGAILDKLHPDFVFFTGDIVVDSAMNQGWNEVLRIAIDRKIPWAAVLGNHDDEHGKSRAQIMDYITTLPFCHAQTGPDNITGKGNFYLRIKHSTDTTTAAILYGMDSNAYCKNIKGESYGYFDFSQVAWYRQTSQKLTDKHQGKPYPALAFFHIPLREYGMLNDTVRYLRVGNRGEKECYGALNTGMYAAMYEAGDVMAMFTGHDHNNDYIGQMNTICLAYGRFSGTATTYGSLTNGARVIELKEGAREFSTNIYTTDDKILFPVVFDGMKLKPIRTKQ